MMRSVNSAVTGADDANSDKSGRYALRTDLRKADMDLPHYGENA